MLDDLKYIHERDAQNALGIIEKSWQQLQQTYDTQFKPSGEITNVIVAGMGGSALAAAISQSWPGVKVPFKIVRGYTLPPYVSEKTLFVASSYSGNTEETLAALEAAEANKAQIVVIAAGGKLGEAAQAKSYPFFKLPDNFQPRLAVFYNLAALVQVLQAANLTDAGAGAALNQAAQWLSQQVSTWLPTVPAKDNKAKQIAQELMGKSVVVYSGPQLFPAAYKWKINVNENAKQIAWCNQLPEFNHNEFLGWTEQPVQKPYAVIDLRSNLEHPRVQKRFEITEKLLSGKRPAPIVINAEGKDLLEQLLWTITLGDFVSVYLAIANGLNPTPVDLIEKLKTELGN